MLRDLVLVDMLELTGSTVATARLLNVSQPNVSRRYRRLARELGLARDPRQQPGRRYSDAAWMPLLRQGVNRHRLASGVLRLAGTTAAEPLIASMPWVHWVPLPPASLAHAEALLAHQLLDGLVLDGDQAQTQTQGGDGLIPLATHNGPPLWLQCRPDPLVLAIARGQGAELER